MAKRIITLCYRKIIDINSVSLWDNLVFNATYNEFLMQAQYYNQQQQYQTFAQLIHHVPDASNLHYLVSSACIGYLQQLDEKIPDIYNILGRQFLSFTSFKFELINSDINNKAAHQIAINFYTKSLDWHETIGNYLLLSNPNNEEEATAEGAQSTDLLQLVPFLSIHTLKLEES